MANYAELKDIINNPTQHGLPAWNNDANQIEGVTMKGYLLALIDSLTVGYQFMGVATPSTNPETPDQRVFYIAATPGAYSNFGLTVNNGEVAILRTVDNNTPWEKLTTGIAPALVGYQYMGVATPTTNPGTPTQKVFYLASQPGTYTNFPNSASNPIIVNDGEVCALVFSTSWSKQVTGAATAEKVNQLIKELGGNIIFKLLTDGSGYPCPFLQKGSIITSIGTLSSIVLTGAGLPNQTVNSANLPYTLAVDGYEKIAAYTSPIRIEDITINIFGIKDELIYDISAHNDDTSYANLASALADVPIRRAGMSVRYKDSARGTYVQYRHIATTLNNFTSESNWQGVEDLPKKGSNNLVTSDGIYSGVVYDVSKKHPTSGVDGGNTYTLSSAIRIIPTNQELAGMMIRFIDNVSGLYKTYQYTGTTDANFWITRNWVLISEEDVPFNFFRDINDNTKAYSKGLWYIHIEPEYVDGYYYSAKCYNNTLYVARTEFGDYKQTVNIFTKAFNTITNDIPVDIVVNNVTIGSICFKDKSLWAAISDTGVPTLDSNKISNPFYIKEFNEPEEHLHITIPDKVYAVVGTELNIWNDTVSRSIDRGLQSPFNYQVNWACAKGMITERGFRFTPKATDVGTTYATCYIYDLDKNLIESKQFAIVVKAKDALNAAKNIAFFGASLGADTCSNLYANFINSDKFTGIAPAMVGTRGTGNFHYDAVGGYTWKDYATSGRYCYRIFVTGVTALEVGATYDLNIGGTNKRFSIIEVNTSSGTGNALLESGYGDRVNNFPTSGTLTKVSGGGDDSVAFDNTGHSDGGEQPNNPLWNSTTQQLDVALYKERVGLQSTDKIDAVAFQFGENDHAVALDTMRGYIIDLYNAFIADNANCKFIIALTTSGGNTVDGAGTNYGAGFNVPQFEDDVYKVRQMYLDLANNASYPNIRICSQSLQIDRYYGYNLVNRAISQRYPTNEKVHNNFVHPGESGYGQISDAYFAAYIGVLTE